MLFNPVYGWFTEGFNTGARLDLPKRSLTPIRCLNMITTSARLVCFSRPECGACPAIVGAH